MLGKLAVKEMTKVANGTSTLFKTYFMYVPYKWLITLKVEISQDLIFNVPRAHSIESSINSWWL
jgi:hypothetical protein